MERTYINEVQKEIGSTVKVQGFIENLRNSKYMAFIVLKDITGKLQITVEKEDHPELVDTIDKLTPDSVITVIGKVMENDYVKMGGIEMIPETIEIESIADALPIVRKEIAATKKKKAVERSSIDQRIDYRWIDLRTDENQLMFKAQSCFVNAMRQFLLERSFIEIHTPKLIAAASESGSEVFKVDYFDRNAYLAQSPQFYKQMAMAAGFERIFETGPVFRAEKSYTNKHSTEFSGFDLEFSYITSYKDVMKMEEELLTAGLKAVKEQYGEQIKEMFGLEVVVPTTPFPVVKLADLYKGLEEEFGYTVDESEKGDLTTEAERLSYDWVKKHYGHEFLFITDYSAEKRAFYHMRDENGVPQGYDLIWRGVEITTGAQREHRYDVLKKQAEEKGLADDVKFYLEFFQYGCPPHGGFGLGIDRLTMLLVGERLTATTKASAHFSCAGFSAFYSLLDAGDLVVLCLDGVLEQVVGDLGVQGDDGGAGLVAHDSLVHLGQGFQSLLHAGFAVAAHHAFHFQGLLHGIILRFDFGRFGVRFFVIFSRRLHRGSSGRSGFVVVPGAVQIEQVQPQGVAHDAEAGQAHGSSTEHGVQGQAEGDE